MNKFSLAFLAAFNVIFFLNSPCIAGDPHLPHSFDFLLKINKNDTVILAEIIAITDEDDDFYKKLKIGTLIEVNFGQFDKEKLHVGDYVACKSLFPIEVTTNSNSWSETITDGKKVRRKSGSNPGQKKTTYIAAGTVSVPKTDDDE